MLSTRVRAHLFFLLPALVLAKNPVYLNPDNANIGLTTSGSDFLWAVFGIMLVSDLAFIYMMFKRPRGTRLFHILPVMILTTATLAYFSMASNLGNAAIQTEFRPPGPTRTIWYVRYIDWVITTPLLLLELLLCTGLSLSEIVSTVFFDIAMIVAGLVGALVASTYKWGYFVFSCFFLFYVWWMLLKPGRAAAGFLGHNVRKSYTNSAFFLMVVWALYPVCWGLADGGNVISVTGEMIFYGILDVLAKPVFCFLHIRALRDVPYETFGFNSGHSTERGVEYGVHGQEKSRLHPHTTSGTTDTNTVNTAGVTGTHATPVSGTAAV